jgi:hypothetical protein
MPSLRLSVGKFLPSPIQSVVPIPSMKASTSIVVSLLFLVLATQVGSASAWEICSDVGVCNYVGCGDQRCACLASQGSACVNGFWSSDIIRYPGQTGISSCREGYFQPLCEQIGMVPVKVCYNFFKNPSKPETFDFRSCPDPLDCPTGTYSANGKNGAAEKACIQCPANSIPENDRLSSPSNVGSEKCVCNLGYAGTPCAACDVGKYKDSYYASTCNECPQGSTSVRGSTSRSSCSCNAGYEKINPSSEYFYCGQCGFGKYKESPGDGPCTSCPSNTESTPTKTSCTPVIKPTYQCAQTMSSTCKCYCCAYNSAGSCSTSLVGAFTVCSSNDCDLSACRKQYPVSCPETGSGSTSWTSSSPSNQCCFVGMLFSVMAAALVATNVY